VVVVVLDADSSCVRSGSTSWMMIGGGLSESSFFSSASALS